jgi:uncharacterized protein (TIGR03083 family)
MMSADLLAALGEECELVSQTALGLSEEDFAKPTRCEAWNVKELIGHLYRAIDRLNVALAEPEPPEADSESVAYWRSYDAATDAPAIAERAKDTGTRYPNGHDLAVAWGEMWPRALDAAGRTDPGRVVVTFGPKLRLDEFLKTRILEVTVHRMDLEDALGRKGLGTDRAVSIVDDILVGLLGEDPPRELEWDVVEFIEVGTGRRPLTQEEGKLLGKLADRFPLMG